MAQHSTGNTENESITYTWSDLNVYVAKVNEKPWEVFLKRKKPIGRRHLLKDGKNEDRNRKELRLGENISIMIYRVQLIEN